MGWELLESALAVALQEQDCVFGGTFADMMSVLLQVWIQFNEIAASTTATECDGDEYDDDDDDDGGKGPRATSSSTKGNKKVHFLNNRGVRSRQLFTVCMFPTLSHHPLHSHRSQQVIHKRQRSRKPLRNASTPLWSNSGLTPPITKSNSSNQSSWSSCNH